MSVDDHSWIIEMHESFESHGTDHVSDHGWAEEKDKIENHVRKRVENKWNTFWKQATFVRRAQNKLIYGLIELKNVCLPIPKMRSLTKCMLTFDIPN